MQTEEKMEVNQENFEFSGGGQNPWATGTYSPKVEVINSENVASPQSTSIDEDDNADEYVNNGVGNQDEAISEKIVADLNEEELPYENVHAIVTAQKLAEEGWLDVDEIPEDIDYPQIYELYKNTAKGRLIQEVQHEVNQALVSAGINEQNVAILNALENGVPLDEITEISRYKKYITLNPADEDEDRKMSVIKERYMAIGLREKDLERQLSAIENSGEVDEAFEESQEFFKDVVQNFDKQQILMAQESIKAQQEMKQRNQMILDRAIKFGDLAGQRLTPDQQKDLQRAIYDRSIIVQVEDQNYAFSPFEEFLYRVNNDFEFQLMQFRNHLFRDRDVQLTNARAKQEAVRDDWEAVRKAQSLSGQKKSIKKSGGQKKGITLEFEVPR